MKQKIPLLYPIECKIVVNQKISEGKSNQNDLAVFFDSFIQSEHSKHRLEPKIDTSLLEAYPDDHIEAEEHFCVDDMYINKKEAPLIEIYQEINFSRTKKYFNLSKALHLAREILTNDLFFQDENKKFLTLFSATGVFGYGVYSIMVRRDTRNQAHLDQLNVLPGICIPENTKILFQ
jgi:hypothetical protein